ncbi:MAG: hypothetical protein WC819_03955 [Parcubacteria group bacterium]|jgi:hypothetical protein
MAKIVGFIPAKELRQRTCRPSKPLTVSLGSAIRAAARKNNVPVPQGKNVADEKV